MYKDQFGEFVCEYRGLKGLTVLNKFNFIQKQKTGRRQLVGDLQGRTRI